MSDSLEQTPLNMADLLTETDLPVITVPNVDNDVTPYYGDLALMPDATLAPYYQTALDSVIKKFDKSSKFNLDRFTESQLPIIKKILKAYETHVDNVIVEAPTGTGKSIIGMIVAETLRIAGNSRSYILTSNKMLQEQMQEDAKEFEVDWTLLKGQGNYTCGENMQSFLQRQCKAITVSRAEKELACAMNCEYLVTRRKCMEADGSIFSYAYFLTTMNYVYSKIGDFAPFGPRDITIFDECHTVADQVQSMFTVEINDKIADRMAGMLSFISADETDQEKLDQYEDLITKMRKTIEIMFGNFDKLSNFNFLTCVKRMAELSDLFLDMCLAHRSKFIPEKSKDVSHQKIETLIERFDKLTTSLQIYVSNNNGKEDLIIRHIEDTFVDTDDNKSVKVSSIILRTLDEAMLMRNHVHTFTHRSLFMSATIGDIKSFAELNGIENYAYISIDSNFYYNKCPIFKVKPAISLAAKEKYGSYPVLVTRINMILDHLHPNDRGIIHTGNYEISKLLQDNIKNPRLIYYGNSTEKEEALEKHRYSKNGVIVGPSLIEGISLDDDLARFQINAKVPYPNLGDALNKAKLNRYPGWYQYKTIQSVIQSFGRPIRHKTDYASLYLMDSCFDQLFRQTRPPGYIENRIKPYDISELQAKINNSDNDWLKDF